MSASFTAQERASSAEIAATGPLRSRAGAARVAQFLVLASPVVVLGLRAWHRRWIFEDGFINFRIVDMVLSGHGPVFNPGERVEAATSTLWLWLLVVGDVVLPLRLEYIAVLFGIILTLAGMGLAIAASVRLQRLLASDSGPITPSQRSERVLMRRFSFIKLTSSPWQSSFISHYCATIVRLQQVLAREIFRN